MRIEYEGLAVSAVTIHTAPSRITKIHGFKIAANDRFLQLHDTKATPAAAAVPLRVWPIYGTAPFGEGFIQDGVQLQYGCTLVVSTTANTYTASAETVDLFVNGASVWDNTGVSTIGDYTTLDEVLQVWAEAAGPKNLVRLEVTDAIGLEVYVQIHASDVPATDKIVESFVLPANGTLDLFFGDGLVPIRQIAGVLYNGCTIAISFTPATYSPTVSADYYMKATYR
jgi:hypothetical protein